MRNCGPRFSPSRTLGRHGQRLGGRCRCGEALFWVIVVQAGVVEDFFFHQQAQRVLELEMLDEDIVFWFKVGPALGGFEVEGQPLLDAPQARALGQVQEQDQV